MFTITEPRMGSLAPIFFMANAKDSQTPLPLRETEIAIEFESQDELEVYDYSDLKGLNYFDALFSMPVLTQERVLKKIKLEGLTPQMLAIAKSIVVHRKPLREILPHDWLRDPNLYENLESLLSFLHADGAEAILADLMQYEMPYLLTLENAHHVVKMALQSQDMVKETSNQQEKESGEKGVSAAGITRETSEKPVSEASASKEDSNTLKLVHPYSVHFAKWIILKSCLFSSPEEATSHFERLHTDLLESCVLKRKIVQLKNSLAQARTLEQKMVMEQTLAGFEKMAEKDQLIIKGLETEVTLSEASAKKIDRFIENVKTSSYPFLLRIRELCEDQKKWHLEEISTKLRESGANMERKDLLDCFTGPREYFISYYQFKWTDKENDPFPFRMDLDFEGLVVPQSYGFRLDDLGPWHLEESMRTIWQSNHPNKTLPSRLIEDKQITQPISEDAKPLREFLLPLFGRWKTCSEEEIQSAKEKLIQFNKWDQLGVLHSDIQIFPPEESDFNLLKGIILGQNGQRSGITINLRSCLMGFNLGVNVYDSSLEFIRRGLEQQPLNRAGRGAAAVAAGIAAGPAAGVDAAAAAAGPAAGAAAGPAAAANAAAAVDAATAAAGAGAAAL